MFPNSLFPNTVRLKIPFGHHSLTHPIDSPSVGFRAILQLVPILSGLLVVCDATDPISSVSGTAIDIIIVLVVDLIIMFVLLHGLHAVRIQIK